MTSQSYGIQPPGYRLPEEAHIGAVELQVTDLEQSVEFYRDFLGFTELSSNTNHAVLGVEGRALVELRSGAKSRMRGRRLGLYHFAILLPDRASLGSVLEHLVRNRMQPGAADHLVSEALYLNDPDGLGIEIYRDRPRSEWNVVGRQLSMATDPLDFDAVLGASAGEQWKGMPSGTTIGHVHLHVGNIEDAKVFYHEAVGLDVIVWSYPGALFLSAGGYHHHLGTNTWAGPQAIPPEPDEPRLNRWQLVLPNATDVATAASNIAAKGFSVTPEEPGGSIAQDPWGTALQLVPA